MLIAEQEQLIKQLIIDVQQLKTEVGKLNSKVEILSEATGTPTW